MPDSLTNIAGGAEITVQHLDGKQERVLVRCLHIKDFPALMRNMGDECAQSEIFCGKDPGWAGTLANSSVVAVYEKGFELNQDFFSQWSQRRLLETDRLRAIRELAGRSMNGSLSSPSAPA